MHLLTSPNLSIDTSVRQLINLWQEAKKKKNICQQSGTLRLLYTFPMTSGHGLLHHTGGILAGARQPPPGGVRVKFPRKGKQFLSGVTIEIIWGEEAAVLLGQEAFPLAGSGAD